MATDVLRAKIKELMPQAKADLARMVSFKSVSTPNSSRPKNANASSTTWSMPSPTPA